MSQMQIQPEQQAYSKNQQSSMQTGSSQTAGTGRQTGQSMGTGQQSIAGGGAGGQQATPTQQTGGSQQAEQLYPSSNFLSEDVRSNSVAVLNQCLADIEVMQSQLKAAHWNLKGPNFFQLHELFEDLYEEFAEMADDIAERATTLGGIARGTVRTTARTTRIPQFPPTLTDEGAILRQLAGSLSALDAELFQSVQTASDMGDIDTVDLLNEVSREVAEALWFVEAHLQGQQTTGGAGGPNQMQQMQSQ